MARSLTLVTISFRNPRRWYLVGDGPVDACRRGVASPASGLWAGMWPPDSVFSARRTQWGVLPGRCDGGLHDGRPGADDASRTRGPRVPQRVPLPAPVLRPSPVVQSWYVILLHSTYLMLGFGKATSYFLRKVEFPERVHFIFFLLFDVGYVRNSKESCYPLW